MTVASLQSPFEILGCIVGNFEQSSRLLVVDHASTLISTIALLGQTIGGDFPSLVVAMSPGPVLTDEARPLTSHGRLVLVQPSKSLCWGSLSNERRC